MKTGKTNQELAEKASELGVLSVLKYAYTSYPAPLSQSKNVKIGVSVSVSVSVDDIAVNALKELLNDKKDQSMSLAYLKAKPELKAQGVWYDLPTDQLMTQCLFIGGDLDGQFIDISVIGAEDFSNYGPGHILWLYLNDIQYRVMNPGNMIEGNHYKETLTYTRKTISTVKDKWIVFVHNPMYKDHWSQDVLNGLYALLKDHYAKKS